MFVKMNQLEFHSLELSELGWACMSPIVEPLRGKDPAVKSRVYTELTPGQKVLFMFYAYYNHAKNSMAEFYWWSAYYLAQPKQWTELKLRLSELGDDDMVGLLEEIECVLRERNHPNSPEAFNVSPDDLTKDAELRESIHPLFTRFSETTEATVERLGTQIRNNPGQFVDFED